MQFLWSYDRIVSTKHKREEYKHVIPSPGSISNLCYCLARIKRYFDIACDLSRYVESKDYLEYQTLIPHHKRYFITRNIDSIGFRGRERVIFSNFRNFENYLDVNLKNKVFRPLSFIFGHNILLVAKIRQEYHPIHGILVSFDEILYFRCVKYGKMAVFWLKKITVFTKLKKAHGWKWPYFRNTRFPLVYTAM